MNTTPETPEAPAVTPAVAERLDEIVTAGKVASKKEKSRSKARRFKGRRRMTRAQRLAHEVRHAFYQWDEVYTQALTAVLSSLANGRRLTATAVVKLAADIADKSIALREKRRPADER